MKNQEILKVLNSETLDLLWVKFEKDFKNQDIGLFVHKTLLWYSDEYQDFASKNNIERLNSNTAEAILNKAEKVSKKMSQKINEVVKEETTEEFLKRYEEIANLIDNFK